MASTTRQPEQSELTLEVRRTFAAPRQRVFDAWTRAEELRRWFAPGPLTTAVAEVDLRVGGRYRVTMRGPDGAEHTVTGVYRAIEPPKRLVYSWRWEDKPSAGESTVTVEFHERGRSTEVVLRHEGLPSAKEIAEHEHGWNGCLEKLESAVQA
jgi:glutathione S-transferase